MVIWLLSSQGFMVLTGKTGFPHCTVAELFGYLVCLIYQLSAHSEMLSELTHHFATFAFRTPCEAKSRQVGLSHCARNVLVYERQSGGTTIGNGERERSLAAAAEQHSRIQRIAPSNIERANDRLQFKITCSRVRSLSVLSRTPPSTDKSYIRR